MELANEAAEAQGSSLRNNEKWVQSYSGKLQKLSNDLQTLGIHMLDSDSFKGAIDIVGSLVTGLDKLIDKFGALSVAAGAFGIAASRKNLGSHKIAMAQHKFKTVYRIKKLKIVLS